MTDEQINQTIAESLEPDIYSTTKPRDWTNHGDCGWISPLKCWQLTSLESAERKLTPADYFHNPAARDLLVRKMLEKGWFMEIWQKDDDSIIWLNLLRGQESVRIRDAYDRIWPLAYLKTLPDAKENAR